MIHHVHHGEVLGQKHISAEQVYSQPPHKFENRRLRCGVESSSKLPTRARLSHANVRKAQGKTALTPMQRRHRRLRLCESATVVVILIGHLQSSFPFAKDTLGFREKSPKIPYSKRRDDHAKQVRAKILQPGSVICSPKKRL